MAPLPANRVTPADAFVHTGLDYLGPLYVKSDSGRKKVWICLFTCLVTRAVHLELVDNLTAEQFVMCLRRFAARRGTPRYIMSDNAPQFKMTHKAIESAWQLLSKDPDVANHASTNNIQWSFITEHAPWMGGVYERMVGLVKRNLRKTVGNRHLTNVQLVTVLTEVEAVVNSRPLIYVGEDVGSKDVITPADFLSLKSNLGFPAFFDIEDHLDPEFVCSVSGSDRLLQNWKDGQVLLDKFWQSWRNEYLLSLRERANSAQHKRGATTDAPRVGMPVLIGDSQQPRGSWKLGVIDMTHPGQDGAIRSATVRTTNGNRLKRPVSLLYPLECESPEPSTPSTASLNQQPATMQSTAQVARPRTRQRRRTAQISIDNTRCLRDSELI